MNQDQERIDLSVIRNQNMLGILLATYFSEDELIDFNFSDLYFKAQQESSTEGTHAILNQLEIIHKADESETNFEEIYHLHFPSGIDFRAINIVDHSVLPFNKFLDIRICKANLYQFDIKCRLDSKNPLYLSIIVAKALNHNNFCLDKSSIFLISRKDSMEIFSRALAESTRGDVDCLIEAKDKLAKLDQDKLIDPNNITYIYDFECGDMSFIIDNTHLGVIRIAFSSWEETSSHYLFLQKNKVGCSALILIIDKALYSAKELKVLYDDDPNYQKFTNEW